MIEIYNEQIYDLLNPDAPEPLKIASTGQVRRFTFFNLHTS